MTAAPWTVHEGRLLVTVRLTPNARDDRMEGVKVLADGKAVLTARVRAIPEDGAANAALEKLLAKAVGVAKSAVAITSGTTQRVKIVTITGDPAVLAGRLAQLAADGAGHGKPRP